MVLGHLNPGAEPPPPAPAAPAAEVRPISVREVVFALLAYLAITAWYWWPMVLEPDGVWSVGRDFFQNSWNLWWQH